ncbi:hypothetical protein [Methanosalsum natronophilum]|nr:hypothetical protein [Methanosalsum natronophilum]MCS3924409.1 hypothetical protein [Methanosalsum natronophilum]
MLCSVNEVKVLVDPKSIDDTEIEHIISHASNTVLAQSNAGPDTENSYLKLACVHRSVSLILEKMKYNGELAQQVKFGSETQQNDVEVQIQQHENTALEYIRKYLYTKTRVISGRAGVRTVNGRSV